MRLLLEQMRKRLIVKLSAMLQLEPGWSFGSGVPVTAEALSVAEEFVGLATLLRLDADVFPNLDGGCAVAFYAGEDSVEVSVSADGSALGMSVERGLGFDYEDVISPSSDVSAHDVYQQIVHLAQGDRWKLHVLFTSSTTTPESADSETRLSSTPSDRMIQTPLLTGVGGSQSSKHLVPVLI